MKLIYSLIAAIDAVVLVVLSFLLFHVEGAPRDYQLYRGDGFALEVPRGSVPHPFRCGLWQGVRFKSFGSLTVYYRAQDPAAPEKLEAVSREVEEHRFYRAVMEKVPLLKNGLFVLATSGKTRRYIYLAATEDRIFWLEAYSRNSTLNTYKAVADRAALSLTVDGFSSPPQTAAVIQALDAKVARYAQSPWLMLSIVIGVLGITNILIFIILWFSGRVPASARTQALRQAALVYLVSRRRFYYHGTIVAAALFPDRLVCYTFGFSSLTVTHDQLQAIRLKEKRGRFFLETGYKNYTIEIYVPDAQLWYNELQNMSR